MSIPSTRPELACEIVPEGVIAARRQPDSGLLASACFAAFGPHGPTAAFAPYLDKDAPRVGLPGVQTGDPQQRAAVVQTLKRALETVGGRAGVLSLIVPDQAVRVLVLDFDSLPPKAADAVPLLKFRLKKMLPFDVDDAAVSYQQIAAPTGTRAVVAVIPNAVLREYEAVVREAGFEPGIVLPSSMACLAMLTADEPSLVVYASTQCVTTTIAGGDNLLLHRTQELPWAQEQLAQTMNPAAADVNQSTYAPSMTAPVATSDIASNRELSEQLDVARYPAIYADPASDAMAEEGRDAIADIRDAYAPPPGWRRRLAVRIDVHACDPAAASEPDAVQAELHQAMAVAAAFYEDSVGRWPSPILVAGAVDSRTWQAIMNDEALVLRDLVTAADLGTAIDSGLSRAQLGAVCGALRG